MSLPNLDGQYEVKTETTYEGEYQLKSDGITEIKNGLTFRKDVNGCTWESSFTPVSDTQVKVESTVDPSSAPEGFQIPDAEGNPTRDVVVYKSLLEAKVEDGKVVLSGTIYHGKDKVRITMTQI